MNARALKRHAGAFTRGFALGFVIWFLRALLPVSFLIALILSPSALRYPGDCARAFRQMWRDPL